MKPEVYKEKRPWGFFEQFTKNQISTVKILTIKAGEEFSLQKHYHREEFWRVLSGEGKIVVGKKNYLASSGNEYFMPVATAHKIQADKEMQILEISLGEFDENDIFRISDKYGRT